MRPHFGFRRHSLGLGFQVWNLDSVLFVLRVVGAKHSAYTNSSPSLLHTSPTECMCARSCVCVCVCVCMCVCVCVSVNARMQ